MYNNKISKFQIFYKKIGEILKTARGTTSAKASLAGKSRSRLFNTAPPTANLSTANHTTTSRKPQHS
jgi:hypothetical protein